MQQPECSHLDLQTHRNNSLLYSYYYTSPVMQQQLSTPFRPLTDLDHLHSQSIKEENECIGHFVNGSSSASPLLPAAHYYYYHHYFACPEHQHRQFTSLSPQPEPSLTNTYSYTFEPLTPAPSPEPFPKYSNYHSPQPKKMFSSKNKSFSSSFLTSKKSYAEVASTSHENIAQEKELLKDNFKQMSQMERVGEDLKEQEVGPLTPVSLKRLVSEDSIPDDYHNAPASDDTPTHQQISSSFTRAECCLFVANLPQDLSNAQLACAIFDTVYPLLLQHHREAHESNTEDGMAWRNQAQNFAHFSSNWYPIRSIKASRDVRGRPYGFVEFDSVQTCQEALNMAKEMAVWMGHRRLRIELAKAQVRYKVTVIDVNDILSESEETSTSSSLTIIEDGIISRDGHEDVQRLSKFFVIGRHSPLQDTSLDSLTLSNQNSLHQGNSSQSLKQRVLTVVHQSVSDDNVRVVQEAEDSVTLIVRFISQEQLFASEQLVKEWSARPGWTVTRLVGSSSPLDDEPILANTPAGSMSTRHSGLVHVIVPPAWYNQGYSTLNSNASGSNPIPARSSSRPGRRDSLVSSSPFRAHSYFYHHHHHHMYYHHHHAAGTSENMTGHSGSASATPLLISTTPVPTGGSPFLAAPAAIYQTSLTPTVITNNITPATVSNNTPVILTAPPMLPTTPFEELVFETESNNENQECENDNVTNTPAAPGTNSNSQSTLPALSAVFLQSAIHGTLPGDIYVGRLNSRTVTTGDLATLFRPYGTLVYVRLYNRMAIGLDGVPIDSHAFVRFAEGASSAERAITEQNMACWHGQSIKVERARVVAE